MWRNIEETAPNPQPLSSVSFDSLLQSFKKNFNPFGFAQYVNLSAKTAVLMTSYLLLSLPVEM
jgi:hypothetical protein